MKTLPPTGASEREVHQAIRDLIEGRSNGTGTVTLMPSTTSTVVSKPTINGNSRVFLEPMTANAAAARATTYTAIVAGGGSFVITHANAATSDRTFAYLVIGG